MKNTAIFDALLTLAKEKPPEVRNFRICAAVVYKHREVISVGYPRRKSHPVQKTFGRNEYSIFLHAEIDALLRAKKLVRMDNNYAIYVARVKHKGAQDSDFIEGNAKPCEGCMQFINKCGINTLIYSDG